MPGFDNGERGVNRRVCVVYAHRVPCTAWPLTKHCQPTQHRGCVLLQSSQSACVSNQGQFDQCWAQASDNQYGRARVGVAKRAIRTVCTCSGQPGTTINVEICTRDRTHAPYVAMSTGLALELLHPGSVRGNRGSDPRDILPAVEGTTEPSQKGKESTVTATRVVKVDIG